MAATQSSKRLMLDSTVGGSGIPPFAAPDSSWTNDEQEVIWVSTDRASSSVMSVSDFERS
jgi:hypothetical protein